MRMNIDADKLLFQKCSTPQMKVRVECSNPKKAFQMNQRAKEIDRENQLLFMKMIDIYSKRSNSVNQTSSLNLPNTLNFRNRKNFQLKIADENQRLFTRIKSQHSEYSVKKISPQLNLIKNKRPRQSVSINSLQNKLSRQNKNILYTGQLQQNSIDYQIKIITEGNVLKIIVDNIDQIHTKVLEMNKSDGLNIIRKCFNNEISKFCQSLIIGDQITINGVQCYQSK